MALTLSPTLFHLCSYSSAKTTHKQEVPKLTVPVYNLPQPQSLRVDKGTEWSLAPHPQSSLAECVPMSLPLMWNLYYQKGEYRLAMPPCEKGVDRRQGQGNGAEGTACVVSNVSVSWPAARWACKAVWGSCGEKPQGSLSNQSRLCSKSEGHSFFETESNVNCA